MHIVQIASEVAPIAKVGGLSDVVLGLSRQLKTQGHTVAIVVPKYDCIDESQFSMQCISEHNISSYFADSWHSNTIWKSFLDSELAISLLDCHHPNAFFNRGCIYGAKDDLDRFLYFSRAVLDWLQAKNSAPDIIHIHDWMLAAVSLLIRQEPFKEHFANTRVVFTIHNIAYQGKCQAYDLEKIGLDAKWCQENMQDDHNSCLNLVKGAILFSDHVTTVSETYAEEVMTLEFGMGLEGVLAKNRHKFSGIVNGIDYAYWSPKTDRHLAFGYSSDDGDALFENKEKNAKVLRERLGLAQTNTKPLVAVVTRLVEQKGVPFIKHALFQAHAKGMQAVVLGTVPDPSFAHEFEELSSRFTTDPDVRVVLEQQEALAHMLYAAADIFLVPSIFEPCGLTQLIALRYGTPPLVRRTGGLADTVFDISADDLGNGFSFDEKSVEAFDCALHRALAHFQDKTKWRALVLRAMQCDYSWGSSALRYIELYNNLLDQFFVKSVHS